MTETQTVTVPHLGGTQVGYRMPQSLDRSKPTLVMVNSFSTSADLFTPQFEDEALRNSANLIAIELFGHGHTRSPSEQFTYWDTAIANLQVMDALGIDKAFVLGTSQGGWVAARMAMLEPERISGIIPLGTSMDNESRRSQELGCWNGDEACSPVIEQLSQPVGDDWVVAGEFTDFILSAGIGGPTSEEQRQHWHKLHRQDYSGDAGRRRLLMSAINLRDRDGLHGRLGYVTCPVLWMHGTADQVYSVANAQEEIKLFTNAKDAKVQVVEGGQHFLSASHPDAVNAATADFIGTWA
jgi:pimeloyl-ACP methyl ester carboxylesterase